MSKIRYVWLYLFTGLLDFLQVWRACKGKAAALHKCLSSLQSRAGKRPPQADHKATRQLLHPALTCLSSLFSRGGLCPVHSKELLPKAEGPGSSQPLPRGTRGHKGTWCRCSGAGCCVWDAASSSQIHMQGSHVFHLICLLWDGLNTAEKCVVWGLHWG